MIILEQLDLKNFLSHKNTTIEFKPQQKILIDGVSGSGKSSLVEAILWCLYNRGRSDNNRSLIKNGEKSAIVTLYFAITSTKSSKVVYCVTRTINRAGEHKLDIKINDKNNKFVPIKVSGKKNLQEFLERDLLHSSYSLFVNSVVYPQNNIENFVQQTAKKRKEIILEIINASDYDEYYEKAKNKLTENQQEFDKNLAVIDVLENDIAGNKNLSENIDVLRDKDKLLSRSIKQTRSDLADVSERIKQQEIINERLDDRQKQLNKLQEEMRGLTTSIEQLDKINDGDGNNRLQEISNELMFKNDELEKLNKIKEDVLLWQKQMLILMEQKPPNHDFNKKIKEINEQLIGLMNKKVQECPTIHKSCPLLLKEKNIEIERLQSILLEVEEKKDIYTKSSNDYKTKILELGMCPVVDNDRIITLTGDIFILKKDKESIEQNQQIKKLNRDKINKITIDIDNLSKEVEGMKKEIIDTAILRKEQNKYDEKISNMTIDYEENLKKLSVAESMVNNLTINLTKKKELNKKNKELKENINGLKLLKDAFSPNGIKAMVIDYVLPRLEDKINNILSQVSDFKIQLDTQRKGIGEDTTLEGLFINIFNENGECFDYDSYSGGEKIKVSLAISEALAEIQNFGFRILDELFVGLDEESVEKFVSVIETFQKRFPQLICISHLRNIKDMFEEKISVRKINGVSGVV